MKNIKIILALSLLLLGCSTEDKCPKNKPDSQLTPETQIGANTMSCKIDGKIWVALGKNDQGDCKEGLYPPGGDNKKEISINGYTKYKCAGLNGALKLVIDTTIYTYNNGRKRYSLALIDSLNYNRAEVGIFIPNENRFAIYRIDPFSKLRNSWVEITRNDTVAKIISGRFEFVAYPTHPNTSPSQVTYITEGRFDFKYGAGQINPCPMWLFLD